MKRIASAAVAVVLICLAVSLLLNSNQRVSSRCLVFTNGPILYSNGHPRSCSVTVSNATDSVLQFAGGFNKFWFQIDYVDNGVWQRSYVRTPGGDDGLLPPHKALRDTIDVPEGTEALRVGLEITSLTWRGRLAWLIAGSSFGKFLKPVAGFLLVRDERNRSKTEWSDVYHLASTNNVNIMRHPGD
jgi:hypothetical protein